ncbi:ABC transporter substrate-binding protein [Aquamicrobium sp. LC103]|uniref:ABC transporter substrate-binding protein n=1 Tax=Aquamicrobium sp. LC103 TaxID=1120658 RepID=UPI0009E2CD6D|nr:ABC transporter substrate-binding protein [Aquamicrobium sp. LC103]TKT77421.1 ABC transporter substrate-binding protein [Aquamicrobium sp. LC103]
MGTRTRTMGLALGASLAGAMLLVLAGTAIAQEPKQGGTLTVRINADMRSTDGIDRDANSDTILHHIFETLVGYRDDLTIGPVLAESWELSQDERTYSFKLREGATYHDGDPVTSADVKWNWERRMDPANEWRCIPFFDGSQGLEIQSVETPDDRTVVFTLEEPNALFLAQLANIQCNGWIASPKNVGDDGKWIDGSAIGSGPFKLAEWEKGQYVALERYDDYRPLKEERSGMTGDRTAYVDAVRFMIIPDTAAAETALFAGEIDVMANMEPSRTNDAKARGANVLSTPGLAWTTILVQTNDPLMSDVRMRRAIAHAIDFKQIAQTRTEGQAGFNPSGVAQASVFFDDDFLAWPEYDPAAAQALLAEAGYSGQPIKLQTNTRYQGMYENSVIVQAMLQAAGINAELEVLDWAAQLDNYLAGKFQLQSFGYSARLDPSLIYGILVGDKEATPTLQWENEEAHTLYLESTRTTDVEKRKEIFKKIHALMEQDVPILGLYFEMVTDAVGGKVHGYEVWPGDKPRAWGVWKE